MFDYCTRALGYSESAANRRIRSARCVARFPEVCGLLDANQANVSTVAQVSRILTEDNKADVLSRMKNRSQREVEVLVAEHEPRTALPGDRVQTVVMRVPVKAPESPAMPLAAASNDGCKETYRRNGGDAGESPQPGLEHHVVIRFSARATFMNKMHKIKSLASHRLPPNPSFEQVFELAMDGFLEKHDPLARHERCANAPARPRADASQASRKGRYVSAELRDRVFARDMGQCTYMGPDGRRCGSGHVLQIDHIQPVARGGASTMNNLRLLCAYHNRLEAGRLMGAGITSRASAGQPRPTI
jgi:hypothetical protein